MGRPKFTLEDCQNYAKSKGGKCLSEIYVNSHDPMNWKCKILEHPVWQAKAKSIQQGHWCPECGGNKKKDINWLHGLSLKFEGKCLSEIYISSQSYYKWKCKILEHPVWQAKADDIRQGHWCPECGGTKKKDLNWLHELARKNDGLCLSTVYVNSETHYTWQCCKGHTWEATAHKIQQGRWCPFCCKSSKISKAQIEIYEFIKKLYPKAELGTKGLLKKKLHELDIWIPNLRIGIEYDGDLYWHSPRFKHFRPNDEKDKDKMCLEAGIKLIRVKETTYVKNKARRLIQLLLEIQCLTYI